MRAASMRVTASDVVGAEVLPPILTDFHEAHPGVAIELVLSNRQEDLLRREADIAVRMARPTQSALTARRVGVVPRRPLRPPPLPRAPRRAASMAEPRATPASASTATASMLSALERICRSRSRRELFAFRSDSDLAQLAALRAGFGIGACQYGIARRDPDLVPVLTSASASTWRSGWSCTRTCKSSRACA